MPQRLSPEEIEHLARRRAGAKMGWYIHAFVYVVVNLSMFASWYYGFGHKRWNVFPAMGWGVGLLLHGVSVFVLGKGSAFRERMIARERERLQRQQDGR